jgi:ribosomal protein S6--L-glutamate ligase
MKTTIIKPPAIIAEVKEKKEEKYRILVVSSGALKSSSDAKGKAPIFHTAKRFKDEAEKTGHDVYILQVESAYIEYEDGVYKIYNADDKEGFEINSTNTVAFVRGTVRLKKSWLDLLSRLEKIGVCMVNDRDTVEVSSDKYRTYLKLQDAGLTQPKTVLIPNGEKWKEAVDNLDSKFPIIMKTLEGSKGIGVLFIESERQIESLVQLLYNQNENIDLLIQEYIKTDGDIRVIVLGGTVLAAMKRSVIEGDFRSNISQGAEAKEYSLTDLEIEHSLLAAKSINGSWTAVDFIPSENPEKDPPYILEVNHSPGTTGIEKATGKNIVKTVIDYYSNQKNRYSVPSQVGYLEVVKITPFGELVAKFDTGNARYSVLHAEDIKVDGKKITFTHGDKTIKTNYVGDYISQTGGGEDERPIVELDFEFTGTKYGKIQFGLNNRDNFNTEVLLNRKIMRLMNVMVNPSRKYVVTTKFSVEK